MPSKEQPVEADTGMFFVDFGPLFGQEVEKILRYGGGGMFSEIIFWADDYSF